MKIKEVIHALERFAPLPLQEDYDNAGLQVGLTEAEVSGVLLCLDVTEHVIDEAIEKGCNMIVSHHPLIFRKLSHITDENYVQRCVIKAIKNDITIVSMHTNLDNVKGGVNYMTAQKMCLDMNTLELLEPRTVNGVEAGSGVIGNLIHPLTPFDFTLHLQEEFSAECVKTNHLPNRNIKRVAICSGAGSFMLQQAIDNHADAFVTGEMHYHEFFGHVNEIMIAVIGHYETEQFTSELLQNIIERECSGIRTVLTEINTNPILYYK